MPITKASPRATLTRNIIGAAIEVHRHTGPGLLESAYKECFAYELAVRALSVAREVGIPLSYKGAALGLGYRLDMVVENEVVVEVKSIANLLPLHTSQLSTYLKLSGLRTGLLINFNVPVLKDGIRRVVL